MPRYGIAMKVREVKRLMGFYEFEVFRGKSVFYADVPRVRRYAKMRH